MENPPVPLPIAPAVSGGGAPRLASRWVAILAAAFTIGNAAWAAWDQDITYDERFHLEWPERLLDERVDARDQFRFDSKTPALLPAVLASKALRAAGIESEPVLRFSTRLQSVVLLALLLWLVARLSETNDPRTRWIGLLLAALDPNLAAHASIATSDVAYTLVVLAFAAALSRRAPTFGRAALIGTAIGTAFAVKYTGVLLVPLAALSLLLTRGASIGRRLGQAFVAAAVACAVASALYLGVGVMASLGSIPLQTPFLQDLGAALPALPLPFPRAVLTGIDASMAHNRPELWASYVFGQAHPGGVWYYFIAQWLMKTPLSLIAAVLLGLWRVRKEWRNPVVVSLALLLVIHLAYFSLFFATQIGLRFALPCVAAACALSARGLSGIRPGWLVAVAGLALVERGPYWGDPIAFTNSTVWPKSRAYWYTADSNLDYGQNRERVTRYAREIGGAFVIDQATVTPGRYVVGANDLTIFERRRSHRWLVENRIPAINVGFTHFAFSITGERFDQYLDAARTAPPVESTDGVCSPPPPHHPPGARIPFEQTVGPEAGRVWVICAFSRKGADLGFRVSGGRVWFGRATSWGTCEADLLQEGQQAWFRIARGAEARLCLVEIPLRRSYIPYRTSGYLTVRGQGADVDIRPVPLEALPLDSPETGSAR